MACQDFLNNSSPIDLDLGPTIDAEAASNYKAIKEVLERLTGLCRDSSLRPKKHEQRLLRNMGAHTVILELLQIPYEKVGMTCTEPSILPLRMPYTLVHN